MRTVQGETDTLNWILTDHLNSTAVTAAEDGSKLAELRYSAFGEIRFSSGTTPTEYQYTGQRNADAGLIFYNARFYDPAISHFVQVDSLISYPGNVLDWDRYSYVWYNPIIYIDPTGNKIFESNNPDAEFKVSAYLNAAKRTQSDSTKRYVTEYYTVAAAYYVAVAFDYGDTNIDYQRYWLSEAANAAIINGWNGTEAAMKIAKTAGFGAAVDNYFGGVVDLAVGALFNTSIVSSSIVENIDDIVIDIGDAGKGYTSFGRLKNAIGSPGEGNQWHHIVEQCQIVKSKFSSEMINNRENIISIPKEIHNKISGYYNTTTFKYTNGLSVRNWLANQDFSTQYEFGLGVLKEFGVIK